MTPSFLAKLQELHDVARDNSLMFFIATNYLDRIDPAAIRKGRIDRKFMILYPNKEFRFSITMEKLIDGVPTLKNLIDKGKKDGKLNASDQDKLKSLMEPIQKIAEKTAKVTRLLSYNGLVNLCEWISKIINQCEDKKTIDTIIKDKINPRLHNIESRRDIEFLPEIDNNFYDNRPRARDESNKVQQL